MPKYMPLAEWKSQAESGTPPADVILHKTAIVEMTGNVPEKRTVDFTISTGAVDREKDVINQAGWDLNAYRKSPVVLFAHDYKQPPIGRTTHLRHVDGALKATVEFAPKEANPMAETVYQLVKGGFLSSASVGFRPHKHAFNAERGGVDFEAQELLEWSIVPVPANPEALMDAKGAGIDTAPLVAWAKGILENEGIGTVTAEVFQLGDKAPAMSMPHKPGCSKQDCPGGAACDGKAVVDLREKQRITAREHDLPDPSLAERLERIETALEKLATPPPVVAERVVDADVVFMLEDEPADDPNAIALDAETFNLAMAEAVGRMVGTEVKAALNHLRGRVD